MHEEDDSPVQKKKASPEAAAAPQTVNGRPKMTKRTSLRKSVKPSRPGGMSEMPQHSWTVFQVFLNHRNPDCGCGTSVKDAARSSCTITITLLVLFRRSWCTGRPGLCSQYVYLLTNVVLVH